MPPPQPIPFREYRPEDLDTCLEIFESNNPKYFRDHERQGFIDWLNDPDRAPYYLFEIDGEVVACAGIYHDPDQNRAGMAWGMVRLEKHGQGIGRSMTQFRIDRMNELYPGVPQHLETIQLTFGFYEKLGFRVVKITPDGCGDGLHRYDMVREP